MKLPKPPTSLKGLPQFCRDAVAWMRANEIANVSGGRLSRTPNGTTIKVDKGNKVPAAPSNTHPWKCSPNGDDTIAYPADGVYTYRAPSLARPVYSVIVAATAGNVTITDNGWLYIKVATTPTNFLSSGHNVSIPTAPTETEHILTLDVMLADSLSVVFNTAAPSTINETAETGAIFIPICEVALTDNIASIVKQWLTYNPPVPVYVNDIS